MAAVTISRSGERLIAVKEVATERAGELEREADLLKRVEHPGVVRFVDLVRSPDGGLALHTEFVSSQTWATRPLTDPAERAAGVAALAAVVADLHDLGLAHLNITPGHVLHGEYDRPVLCGMNRADEATPDNRLTDLAALADLCEAELAAKGALANKLSSLADAARNGRLSARDLARKLDQQLAKRSPRSALSQADTAQRRRGRVWQRAASGRATPHQADSARRRGRVWQRAASGRSTLSQADTAQRRRRRVWQQEAHEHSTHEEPDATQRRHGRVWQRAAREHSTPRQADPTQRLGLLGRVPRRALYVGVVVLLAATGVVAFRTWCGRDPVTVELDPVAAVSEPAAPVEQTGDAMPVEAELPDENSPAQSSLPVEDALPSETLLPAESLLSAEDDELLAAQNSPPVEGEDALPADESLPVEDGDLLPVEGVVIPSRGVAPDDGAPVLDHDGRRYSIGIAGDLVAKGDWHCDGNATPAIVRPSTGDVVLFDRWPGPGETLSMPVLQTVDAPVDVEVFRDDSCDLLRVLTATGSQLINPRRMQ